MKYKYLTPIIAIYMALSFADLLSVYRIADIGGVIIAGGIFILPTMYFLEDLIAEVYGYKKARQAIWSMLIGCLVFASAISLIDKLPAPSIWHEKKSYDLVFSHLFRIIFGGGCVGLIFGSFINSIFLSKWKILTRGKYFVVRSITSSAIGQAIQNILNCFILYLGVLPLHNILSMIMPLYVIQMALSAILALVGNIFIILLKRAEGAEVYDYGINYNPFAISSSNDDKNSVKIN